MSSTAFKTALGNIKKMAKQSIVERYKAKKAGKTAPPAKVEEKKEPEPESEKELEEETGETDDDDAESMTEIIVTPDRKRAPHKPEIPSGGFSTPKRGRGRPPGSKNKPKK